MKSQHSVKVDSQTFGYGRTKMNLYVIKVPNDVYYVKTQFPRDFLQNCLDITWCKNLEERPEIEVNGLGFKAGDITMELVEPYVTPFHL